MSIERDEGQRAAAKADRDIAQVPVAATPVQAAAAPVQAAAHVEHVESESDAGGGGIIASKTSRALSFEKIDEKGVRKKSKDREKQKKDRKKRKSSDTISDELGDDRKDRGKKTAADGDEDMGADSSSSSEEEGEDYEKQEQERIKRGRGSHKWKPGLLPAAGDPIRATRTGEDTEQRAS